MTILNESLQSFIKASSELLKNWAIQTQVRPKRTSFHAAMLLHRGKPVLNNQGKIIAATNSPEYCAERNLVLCLRKKGWYEKH